MSHVILQISGKAQCSLAKFWPSSSLHGLVVSYRSYSTKMLNIFCFLILFLPKYETSPYVPPSISLSTCTKCYAIFLTTTSAPDSLLLPHFPLVKLLLIYGMLQQTRASCLPMDGGSSSRRRRQVHGFEAEKLSLACRTKEKNEKEKN